MEGENKIASELISIISKYPYKRFINYISPDEAMTEELFQTKGISRTHWLDTRNCYWNGSWYGNFLFDLFGSYSGEEGIAVRQDMIARIKLEGCLYNSVSNIVLGMRNITLESWLTEMEDDNQFPDEVMLYALSRTYNRHCLVLCKSRNWSTVESPTPVSEAVLMFSCHILLVYMGNGIYGQLKPRPFKMRVENPFTLEHLQESLNKVKGRGKPRTKPLNLVLHKDHTMDEASTNASEVDVDSGMESGTYQLSSEDKENLHKLLWSI